MLIIIWLVVSVAVGFIVARFIRFGDEHQKPTDTKSHHDRKTQDAADRDGGDAS